MSKGPVRGMNVDKQTAAATAEYQRDIYYFCSHGCHKAFTADPQKYAQAQSQLGTSTLKEGR